MLLYIIWTVFYVKVRHSIVVTNKNCEAILVSAPAKSVRFFKENR